MQRMRVACVPQGLLELGRRDPLREEVGGHLDVRDVLEDNLSVLDASLEHSVASEEVLRAGGAADAGSNLLVR